MTKELTYKIKEILQKHSEEAYKCLYPAKKFVDFDIGGS